MQDLREDICGSMMGDLVSLRYGFSMRLRVCWSGVGLVQIGFGWDELGGGGGVGIAGTGRWISAWTIG